MKAHASESKEPCKTGLLRCAWKLDQAVWKVNIAVAQGGAFFSESVGAIGLTAQTQLIEL